MKPYAVLRYDLNRVYDFGGPREARNTYYAPADIPAQQEPSAFLGTAPMYFADTEVEAHALGQYLASKYANIQWLVVKTTDVFQSVPGQVKQSKFSDKGLLPV